MQPINLRSEEVIHYQLSKELLLLTFGELLRIAGARLQSSTSTEKFRAAKNRPIVMYDSS